MKPIVVRIEETIPGELRVVETYDGNDIEVIRPMTANILLNHLHRYLSQRIYNRDISPKVPE
jgi:hypothetical protein